MKRITPFLFGLFSLLILFWALIEPRTDYGAGESRERRLARTGEGSETFAATDESAESGENYITEER